MKAGARAAGAKCTAETAEVQNGTAADASGIRWTGKELQNNCRKTAEQLQKLSSVSDTALTFPKAAPQNLAPALVHPLAPVLPREVKPTDPPARRGDSGPGDAGRHTLAKRGRAWAVHDPAGELVALTLYRKGAAEVVRRELHAALAAVGHPAGESAPVPIGT